MHAWPERLASTLNTQQTTACHAVLSRRSFSEGGSLVHRRVNLPLNLFVNDLDLLVYHLAGETVDRDMHLVMLFPFDDEIVCETRSVWLVVAGLSHHINQHIPHATLRHRRSSPRYNFALGLDALIIRCRCWKDCRRQVGACY